jgi:hypothetical protein
VANALGGGKREKNRWKKKQGRGGLTGCDWVRLQGREIATKPDGSKTRGHFYFFGAV